MLRCFLLVPAYKRVKATIMNPACRLMRIARDLRDLSGLALSDMDLFLGSRLDMAMLLGDATVFCVALFSTAVVVATV
jgi:hypothetical protein